MRFFKPFFLSFALGLLLPFSVFAQRNDGAVIPGDFADPSIIRVKNTYYAVGTSSEWAPHFPIYKSTNLKNWQQVGYAFDKTPAWTSGSFWAPEYYKIGNTYYLYYTARRKSDNTSYIGVATSRYPDKGFVNHGVLIPFGKEAIDAFIFNDNGQLYITFKAYGLDNRPIEILGYKLSANGLKLEGEPFSLLKDEPRIGMEGQSILKKDGYYYLFYSAGNCCGTGCSYNIRVARAKNFAGPYEVYANNPILSENEKWKCMGHGTFVTGTDGAEYYLHHAYNRESTVYTGRQGLMSQLTWPQNHGWPVFTTQKLAGGIVPNITDNFNTASIAKYWAWDFRNSTPKIKQQAGTLHLSGSTKAGNQTGIVLAARSFSGSFDMAVTVANNNTALKGLAYYGDANAALGIGTQNNKVIVWQVADNKFANLAEASIKNTSPVEVKFEVAEGKDIRFFYRQGKTAWTELKTAEPAKLSSLPQWDRSPRGGLHFKGAANQEAAFKAFSVVNK
ncbi:glycoside hydrolase family 43 protein [Mucilaginibacter pedocola]|uniref:Beta-xylosidase n=1 Tax=Mucilaginibacter pedocola TaxID=1792845 RepID=A0A1S9PBM4_9SPHI|nr:glycoside hydrolase family 43 protein [Mucilaginibacter pedocola]OOQ58384.1 beta-xylosidase [Mucilaginibacter pedocola]